MYDPEDDNCEYVSPEELAEITAAFAAEGLVKDSKIDWEAIDAAPRIPFTEYYEWLDEKYGRDETADEP